VCPGSSGQRKTTNTTKRMRGSPAGSDGAIRQRPHHRQRQQNRCRGSDPGVLLRRPGPANEGDRVTAPTLKRRIDGECRSLPKGAAGNTTKSRGGGRKEIAAQGQRTPAPRTHAHSGSPLRREIRVCLPAMGRRVQALSTVAEGHFEMSRQRFIGSSQRTGAPRTGASAKRRAARARRARRNAARAKPAQGPQNADRRLRGTQDMVALAARNAQEVHLVEGAGVGECAGQVCFRNGAERSGWPLCPRPAGAATGHQ